MAGIISGIADLFSELSEWRTTARAVYDADPKTAVPFAVQMSDNHPPMMYASDWPAGVEYVGYIALRIYSVRATRYGMEKLATMRGVANITCLATPPAKPEPEHASAEPRS